MRPRFSGYFVETILRFHTRGGKFVEILSSDGCSMATFIDTCTLPSQGFRALRSTFFPPGTHASSPHLKPGIKLQ